MDAVIRFCFLVDASKIEDLDEYAKLFGQAKYILDYNSIMQAKNAMKAVS